MKKSESEPSLVEAENTSDPVGPRHLTESQSAAFLELSALCQIAGHGESYGGFVPRTKPVLLGPSGSGKSALVARLADSTGLPLLRLSAGNWVVYSARSGPYSLDVLRRFVRENEKGIVLLDEIDKALPPGTGAFGTDWNLSVLSELLSVYDTCPRLLTAGWTKIDVDRLKQFFLISAGAWQRAAVEAEANNSSHVVEVMKDFGLPQELAYRFNARPITLQLPSRTDFIKAIARVHADLGLRKIPAQMLEELVSQAVAARCGLRWVEQYVSDLLSSQPSLRRKSAPRPQETERSRKTPVSAATWREHREHFFRLLEGAELSVLQLQVQLGRQSPTFWPPKDDADLGLDDVMNAERFDGYCEDLLQGFHYRYAISSKSSEACLTSIWAPGHKLLHFLCLVLRERLSQLDPAQLALVQNVRVKLARILSAFTYLGSMDPQSE